MRLSFVIGCALASMVVGGVLACGGDEEGSAGPYVPEGGTITEDGAVVGPDGELIEQPDASKPKPSKVNATAETVNVMGNTRDYVLAVPKTYDAGRKYPLIIALHGDGQDAAGLRAFVPLDDLAGEDAIVAYPDRVVDLFTAYEQNADQLLVGAAIDAVKGKYSVDAAKVWAFGYSKGGFVAHQLACRKPGMFAAIAVHASGKPQDETCPGVIGLPVLATEGDGDTGIGAVWGAQYWASVNGCSNQRSATTPAPCEKHNGCPVGKPVVYCLSPGVGHYPIWGKAAEVSWAFFNEL